MGLFSIIISKWRLISIGLVLAALAGAGVYIQILKLQKSELTTENKSLGNQLKESQANLQQLKNDIVAQNVAVEKFKDDANLRLAASQADLAKAKVTSVSFKSRATDVMAKIIPTGETECGAANALINEEITNVVK